MVAKGIELVQALCTLREDFDAVPRFLVDDQCVVVGGDAAEVFEAERCGAWGALGALEVPRKVCELTNDVRRERIPEFLLADFNDEMGVGGAGLHVDGGDFLYGGRHHGQGLLIRRCSVNGTQNLHEQERFTD